MKFPLIKDPSYIPKLDLKNGEIQGLKHVKRGFGTYISRHFTNKSAYKTCEILQYIKNNCEIAERKELYQALKKKHAYFSEKKINGWIHSNDNEINPLASTVIEKKQTEEKIKRNDKKNKRSKSHKNLKSNHSTNSSSKADITINTTKYINLLKTIELPRLALRRVFCIELFFKKIVEEGKVDDYLDNISSHNLEKSLEEESGTVFDNILLTNNVDLIEKFINKVLKERNKGNIKCSLSPIKTSLFFFLKDSKLSLEETNRLKKLNEQLQKELVMNKA